MISEKHDEEMVVADELRALAWALNADADGTIGVKDIVEGYKISKVRHKFELLGINIRDAGSFFFTLSAIMRTERLTIDQFVDGCLEMKGNASRGDIQAVRFQLSELAKE